MIKAKGSRDLYQREKNMKRAMGLVLTVLAFGLTAHADRISSSNEAFIGRAGEVIAPQAATTEALSGFGALDISARLTDDVFNSRFSDSAESARDSTVIQEWLDGFWGTVNDRRNGRLGIGHRDPIYRSILGVQEVSEPGTLLLMGMGLALLAVGMRRGVVRSV
jgi:hypothetical protein